MGYVYIAYWIDQVPKGTFFFIHDAEYDRENMFLLVYKPENSP